MTKIVNFPKPRADGPLEAFTRLAQKRLPQAVRDLYEQGIAMGLEPDEAAVAIITGCIRAQAFLCLRLGFPADEFDGLLAQAIDDLRANYQAHKAKK